MATDKCELCEMRDQEVKKLVRAKRGADELIMELSKENEKLREDVLVLQREVQVMLGRIGRSAEFAAAQKAAGIEWLPDVDENGMAVLKEPLSFNRESKAGVIERLINHFKRRS